jgi:hypothetical protein
MFLLKPNSIGFIPYQFKTDTGQKTNIGIINFSQFLSVNYTAAASTDKSKNYY